MSISVVPTTRTFKGALHAVQFELRKQGCWSAKLARVSTRQTPFGFAYGWQYYRGCGDIVVPRISVVRLWDRFWGTAIPLRDVLRHEYAHAVADSHRSLVRGKTFRCVFGGDHDSETWFEYDVDSHVSVYASSRVCEDFAEVFMYYMKFKGRLPTRFDTPQIARKWNYIELVCNQMKQMK